MKHYDALIIGAGLAGLTLARRLRTAGQSFLILEKSRGVGGRLATRRDGSATYDHGAQFYKNRDGETFLFDDELSRANVVRAWFMQDKALHKAAPGGMTKVAKALAVRDEILLEQKVIRLLETPEHYCRVELEGGGLLAARRVYLTAPLPQALELLKQSDITFRSELNEVTYAKALVGLFEVQSSESRIINFVYEQNISESLFSVANQLSKGVSESLAFTAVMTPDWSEDHFDDSEEVILSGIQSEFEKILAEQNDGGWRIQKSSLKKWRYAHPLMTAKQTFEAVGSSGDIVLIGDAFGGPSLAGACRSAMAAPIQLKN